MRRTLITRPGQLVEQYLQADEQVIFDAAPDLKAWVINQWFDLMVVGVLVVMMFAAGDSRVTAFGLLFEVVLLGSIAWRYADHAFTRYVLTDHRALRMSGVLRRDHEWMSWSQVTDVSVHRSITDRWFGTATIKIQSANEASGFKEMADVPDPAGFAQTIADMVNSANGPIVIGSGAVRR